ncbi:hypothetical protein FHR70_003611 [Microvirga lupini]|uniref:Uncharacterized protein n=1 Tax=Microvirga lupini TaxID=420324 RepID=A0A7W4YXH5_9HYPH|nr:hypothetical protein [Microvirga lupini]
MTAGVGAGVGGSNGVDVGVGVGIGNGGTSGGGIGGPANPGRPGSAPSVGSVRNPPTTGGIGPNRPGNSPQVQQLQAEIRNMSPAERMQLRRSCAMVVASPDSYEADMQTLCRLMSRMSVR